VNEPWSDKRQCNYVHNATFIMNGSNGSTVKMKWFSLHMIMSSALDLLPDEANLRSVGTFKGLNIFTGFTNKDEEVQRDGGRKWKASIMARHNGVAQTGCQHPADRLSIMINMCGTAIQYIGRELNDKDEVFFISVLIALAAGEVHPLGMIGGRSLCLEQKPTWLQRGTVEDETRIAKFELGNVKGIHCISTETIELDLIFFSGPSGVIRDDEDLKSTYHVFPDLIPTTNPEHYIAEPIVGSTFSDDSDSDLDIHRRRFLAVCIMNGVEYTVRLWEQLKRDVVHGNYNGGVYKDLQPCAMLRAPAERFIGRLSKPSTSSPTTTARFDLDEAQLLLTWLTDPRSMYYIGRLKPLRMQCTVSGEQCVMTALINNDHFNDGPGEELRAALPTDWLGATCIPLRLWILRPVKSDKNQGDVVRWRIVGKGLLLGEPDLMEEVRINKDREDAVLILKERTLVGG
jgi:hypothetical protein